MIIEIIGVNKIQTDNKAEVLFKTGRREIYDPKEIKHVVLSGVEVIKILKDKK